MDRDFLFRSRWYLAGLLGGWVEFIPDSLAELLGCDDAMHCRYSTETKTLGKHLNSSAGGSPQHLWLMRSLVSLVEFLSFRLRRACHNQAKLFAKCGTKNGPMGAISVAVPKQDSMELGTKLSTPKTQSVQLGTLWLCTSENLLPVAAAGRSWRNVLRYGIHLCPVMNLVCDGFWLVTYLALCDDYLPLPGLPGLLLYCGQMLVRMKTRTWRACSNSPSTTYRSLDRIHDSTTFTSFPGTSLWWGNAQPSQCW